MNKIIYFDNNSTTKIDPLVLEYIMPYLEDKFGNSSSNTHTFGREAKEAAELSRERISRLINCNPEEIIFTSGTTESINLAIKGTVESSQSESPHIITSVIEHSAVLEVCRYLERYGIEVTYIPVDKNGTVDPDDIRKEIRKNTIMISIMTANNEIGTIQPIAEIGELCREKGIIFHTDSAQAVGKIHIDMKVLDIDMMSFSAHKMYGPKGTGALYIRNGIKKPSKQIHGGGQESGIRGGTLNIPSIAGFGKAAEIALEKMSDEFRIHTTWRDRIIQNILQRIEGSFLNGHLTKRLPNNINIGFREMTNSMFISRHREFAISFGSACSSETLQPSYVLREIGRTEKEINSSIRIGLGRFNTEEEINYFINKVTKDF